jgi:hypothetical protein
MEGAGGDGEGGGRFFPKGKKGALPMGIWKIRLGFNEGNKSVIAIRMNNIILKKTE